jgi:hypothetical protein
VSHAANLERVTNTISAAVLDFAARHVGREFHADDLRYHTMRFVGFNAPNSAYRVMYALRKAGRLNYTLVDRRRSLYRIDAIRNAPALRSFA